MPINLDQLLDEMVKVGQLLPSLKLQIRDQLLQEEKPEEYLNAVLLFGERHNLYGWTQMEREYKNASAEEVSEIEGLIKARMTPTVEDMVNAAMADGIISQQHYADAVRELSGQTESLSVAAEVFEYARKNNLKNWLLIWNSFKISKQRQKSALEAENRITLEPEKTIKPAHSLDQVVELLINSEKGVLKACVALYEHWNAVKVEDEDLYEFLDKVEAALGGQSRSWIFQKFHIGEIVVKSCHHQGLSVEEVIQNKAFQNTDKWQQLYAQVAKVARRNIHRSEKTAGRPLTLLEETLPLEVQRNIQAVLGVKQTQSTKGDGAQKPPTPRKARVEGDLDKKFVMGVKSGAITPPSDPKALKKFRKQLDKQLVSLQAATATLTQLRERLSLEAATGK